MVRDWVEVLNHSLDIDEQVISLRLSFINSLAVGSPSEPCQIATILNHEVIDQIFVVRLGSLHNVLELDLLSRVGALLELN